VLDLSHDDQITRIGVMTSLFDLKEPVTIQLRTVIPTIEGSGARYSSSIMSAIKGPKSNIDDDLTCDSNFPSGKNRRLYYKWVNNKPLDDSYLRRFSISEMFSIQLLAVKGIT
jgi:hypothetical protein